MLFTLNAPSAYLPFSALVNSSLVCVSGIGSAFAATLLEWSGPILQMNGAR